MEKEPFALNFPERTLVSIVGLAKNVGKTTFLNFLSQRLSEEGRNALLLSVGRDGEGVDRLEFVDKPPVCVPEGFLVFTPENFLGNRAAFEVLDSFPEKLGSYHFVMARALVSTEVELVTPGSFASMEKAIAKCFCHNWASNVLVDGALGRQSHAGSLRSYGVFLVSGGSVPGAQSEVVRQTLFAVEKLELPPFPQHIAHLFALQPEKAPKGFLWDPGECEPLLFDSLIQQPEICGKIKEGSVLFNPGVVTSSLLQRLFQRRLPFSLVVEDGSAFLVEKEEFDRMRQRGIAVYARFPLRVLGIVVNPWGVRRSVEGDKLVGELKQALPGKMVWDVLSLTS
ncbi:MAG TPA: hypothetical protein P5560_01415 [Thermotogota bacterium]|nr:hypothetical protein [Thermotogota bacterium]HRW91587.1 hypothetical protein [Thermotogota bacterium]